MLERNYTFGFGVNWIEIDCWNKYLLIQALFHCLKFKTLVAYKDLILLTQ